MWERNFSQANARPLLLLSCESFTLLEHTKSVCDELVKKYLRSSREPSRMKLQQSIRSISQEDFESTKKSIVKLLLLDLVVVLRCLSSEPQKPSPLIIKISKIFLSSIFIWTLPRRTQSCCCLDCVLFRSEKDRKKAQKLKISSVSHFFLMKPQP